MGDKLEGVLVVLTVLIIILVAMFLTAKRNAELNPSRGIKSWTVSRVSEPTTVWRLAQSIAKDKYDTRDVVELIATKNPGLKKSGYDLRIEDKITLPVFQEK